MVQLRIYDPLTGAIQAAMTAPVANGRLDYLGCGQYVSTNADTVEHFEVRSDMTAVLLRTLVTFGLAEDGVGIAVQRQQASDIDAEFIGEANGPLLFVGMSEVLGGIAAYGLRIYDLASGALCVTHQIASVPLTLGGLCTDGRQVFVAMTDTTPNILVISVDVTGFGAPSARIVSSLATQPADLTFDGQSIWTIEGTTAKQYGFGQALGLPLINSFALTGVAPTGICFDGQNLIVLSRT